MHHNQVGPKIEFIHTCKYKTCIHLLVTNVSVLFVYGLRKYGFETSPMDTSWLKDIS